MARICSGCNKFASIEAEIESCDLEVQNDGNGGATITGTVEMILNSQCCGMEVARASIDADHDIAAEAFTHGAECDARSGHIFEDDDDEDGWLADVQFSIDADAEAGERYQDKDRNGKPIRNFRYQRKFYTADVTGTVSCDGCDAEYSMEGFTVEEQASGFEDSN